MLEQDTYYYGTDRVIDALDFYLDSVQPPSKIGVGMSCAKASCTPLHNCEMDHFSM